MTREEAIEMLKSKMDGKTDTSYEWCECVRMAIKALSEQESDTGNEGNRIVDICNDNRFEMIEKYLDLLKQGTNIETSQEEMQVIDNILFRFWQMGWLDKIDFADTIIRCKDCKKYKPYDYPYLCGECENCSYDVPAKIVKEDGYCDEGERKDNDK